jgi:hypothetical protein
MRPIHFAAAAVGLALVVASPAFAGKIFGDIKIDGKPVPEGMKVRISVPGAATVADSTTTDKFGSYKLMVKGEGKCTLTVVHEKLPAELAVFSNKEATRYDLILEKKDGKPSLRRK